MGGALVISSIANANDEFSSAAPFYGVPDLTKISIANIKIPVVGHFGEHDEVPNFSDKATALKLEAAAKEAGVDFTLRMWDAGHGFMNASNPAHYNEAAAKGGLAEAIAFFKRTLA